MFEKRKRKVRDFLEELPFVSKDLTKKQLLK